MAVTWTQNKNGVWSGVDPKRPRFYLQIWSGHVFHWTLSTDERRIRQADARSLPEAQKAAEAALAFAAELKARPWP